jgi:iron complex outermembrane receptor protein
MPALTWSRKISIVSAFWLLNFFGLPASAQIRFDLPAQPLAQSLTAVGSLASLNIYYDPPLVRDLKAPALKAVMSADDALTHLLVGTGLRAVRVDANTVRVIGEGTSKRTQSTHDANTGALNAPANAHLAAANTDAESVNDKTPGQRSEPARAMRDTTGLRADEHDQLEEVIVTAQKRDERLIDVPGSISAISAERLQVLEVNSLSDLANYVPGLSVQDNGAPGFRQIVIRGLNTNTYNNTTAALVGTYIDDLPVGGSIGKERSGQYGADLSPYDIDGVEILKGPQGTLYGASTMGGLIKYTLRRPDLQNFDAQVGGNLEGSDGADRPSGVGRAAVNLPIVPNQLALRISGFYRNNAGYIDNVGLGEKYSNQSTEVGGLATLLWQATDRLSVRAMALLQNVNAENTSTVTLDGATLQPVYGPLSTSTRLPEPFKQRMQTYSISVDWDLSFAKLTSASGWSRITDETALDLSNPFGKYCLPGYGFASNPGCPDYPHSNALADFSYSNHMSKFVEEVRLTSSENRRIQWMLGGFYTRESAGDIQNFYTLTPNLVPLPAANDLQYSIFRDVYKESAVFANATYKFNDRFDIGAGERYSAYNINSCVPQFGGIFGSPPQPCNHLPSVGVSVWMANARFHLDQDSMFYVRVSTGYRPGSGCPTCGNPKLDIPGIVNPDKTTNYEGGFKGQFLDRRLEFDLAAFYIDWRNIQLTLLNAEGVSYPGNGATASSSGFELTAAYLVADGLHLQGTVADTNAHLTEDAPGVGARAGDQLPVSPRWTASLTADYTRPLDAGKSLLLGGGYRYRDTVVSEFPYAVNYSGSPSLNFTTRANQYPIGPQNIVDLYTGLRMQQLTLRLYGKNIFNNRSYSGLAFLSDPTLPRFIPIQPRTIGLSVDYKL